MRKIICIILVVAMLCSMTACSGETVFVTGIEVNDYEATILLNEKIVIKASVVPYNASNQKIVWESSDEKVASVANGVVLGKTEGVATISARTADGDFVSKVDIEVISDELLVSKAYNYETEGFGRYKFSRINDALASCNDGDRIRVMSGVYNEVVNITKPVEMYGEKAYIDGHMVIGSNRDKINVTDTIIDGFTFVEGNKVEMVTGLSNVYIGKGVGDLEIRNCSFIGESGTAHGISTITGREGISIDGLTIERCEFTNYENPIDFNQYVSKANVIDNKFNNCQYAMSLEGAQKTVIEGNVFENSGVLIAEHAQVATSRIQIEQNKIISPYKDGEGNEGHLFSLHLGTLRKGDELDLSNNNFFGKKVSVMTKSDKEKLYELIDVKDPVTLKNDYSYIVID